MDCGSYKFEGRAAAIHELPRGLQRLVHCSSKKIFKVPGLSLSLSLSLFLSLTGVFVCVGVCVCVCVCVCVYIYATFKFVAAAMHEPQSTRSLMFSWIVAARGLRQLAGVGRF